MLFVHCLGDLLYILSRELQNSYKLFLLTRRYACAVFVVIVCLSVHLSLTSVRGGAIW